jgi:hypothetical protein
MFRNEPVIDGEAARCVQPRRCAPPATSYVEPPNAATDTLLPPGGSLAIHVLDLCKHLTSHPQLACGRSACARTPLPAAAGGYANGFEQLCSGQPECLKVSTFHIGALGDSACDAGLCASMAASKCASPERREPIPSTLYQVWTPDALTQLKGAHELTHSNRLPRLICQLMHVLPCQLLRCACARLALAALPPWQPLRRPLVPPAAGPCHPAEWASGWPVAH